MKNLYFISICLLYYYCFPLLAHTNPTTSNEKTYSKGKWTEIRGLSVTPSGETIVAAYIEAQDGTSSRDVWIFKLDHFGGEVWSYHKPTHYYEMIGGVTIDYEGHVLIVGTNTPTALDEKEAFVLKLNSNNGQELWKKSFGGRHNQEAFSIVSRSDGGYWVAGYTEYERFGEDKDICLWHLDVNGNLLSTLPIKGEHTEVGHKIITTQDGNFAIAATKWWSKDKSSMMFLKVDALGTILSEQTYGNLKARASDICELSNGNLVIVGAIIESRDKELGYIIWIDKQGSKIDELTPIVPKNNHKGWFNAVVTSPNRRLFLTGGVYKNEKKSEPKIWFLELSQDKKIISNKVLENGEGWDIGYENQGGVLIGGYQHKSNQKVGWTKSLKIQISSPTIQWLNPSKKNIYTNSPNFTLQACIQSPTKIEKIELYINKQPQRNRGLGVKPANNCPISFSREIKLNQAETKVQLKITTQNNVFYSEERTIILDEVVVPRGRTNHLLLIAIDEYNDKRWQTLHNPVKDVEDVKNVLTSRYQFEEENITTIYNRQATWNEIDLTFRRLSRELTESDNLIIYYAGHGELDKDYQNEGYWIPVDAPYNVGNSKYLSHNKVFNFMESSKCHHVFLISDACFSGALFYRSGSPTSTHNYESVDALKSRRALVSGRFELVWDGFNGMNSPFATSIIAFLKAQNRDFASSMLEQHVKEAVPHNASQTPDNGPLLNVGDQRGEFVFRLK